MLFKREVNLPMRYFRRKCKIASLLISLSVMLLLSIKNITICSEETSVKPFNLWEFDGGSSIRETISHSSSKQTPSSAKKRRQKIASHPKYLNKGIIRLADENRSPKSSMSRMDAKEWMSCEDIKRLLRKAAATKKAEHQSENAFGNKAVFLSTVVDPNEKQIKVVIKSAFIHKTLKNGDFTYHSAIREVNNLRKVRSLKWNGAPSLLGVCMSPKSVIYVVEYVPGKPLCNGSGYDMNCTKLISLIDDLRKRPDSKLATLKFLSKIICFFQQFEKYKVLMEDVSGSNLFYTPETLDIFVVDVDSLIFYGNDLLLSRTYCKSNGGCPTLNGYLWKGFHESIYSSCKELQGNCVNATCRGIDSSIHTCAIGQWIVSTLQKFVPEQSAHTCNEIASCMTTGFPQNRCSLLSACEKITTELTHFD